MYGGTSGTETQPKTVKLTIECFDVSMQMAKRYHYRRLHVFKDISHMECRSKSYFREFPQMYNNRPAI